MDLLAAPGIKEGGRMASGPLGDLAATLPTAAVAEGCCPEICAICLEVPAPGEEVASLPCSHGYHRECIQEWLLHSHLCPLCKRPADAE